MNFRFFIESIEDKNVHRNLKCVTSQIKSFQAAKTVVTRAKSKKSEIIKTVEKNKKNMHRSISFHGDTVESFRKAECALSKKNS